MSDATEDETPDEAPADASDEQADDVTDAPAAEDDSDTGADAEDAEAEEATDEAEPVEEAYGCSVTYSMGQRVIHVPREAWAETAATLLADGWEVCVDVTAVDYSAHHGRALPDGVAAERFEVVASFLSHSKRERLRARTQVPDDDPSVASLYALYPGTDYSEREVYDLFGITFEGHPDLSRILMPETWEGHPLRKDFTVGSVPVQFKAPAGRSEVQP